MSINPVGVSAPALSAASPKAVTRLAGFLSSCASIGAICESSPWLARRIAEAVGGASSPVVELGAGYGSVTAYLPEPTVSIERDTRRYQHLKATFPNRMILNSCAVIILNELQKPTVIVSSIPNVNNLEFGALRAGVTRAVEAGTVKQLISYTYFPVNPFGGIFAKSEMIGFEILNLPPAFVWKYSC